MKPDFAIITEHEAGDSTVVEVDTSKATYQGLSWNSLGDFGKRKFENLLFLERPTKRIKVIYV